jgi:hypothetical protein
VRQTNEPARQIGTIDRMREEEAQRRHDAVHRRHGNAILLLLDLEPAQVVGGRCIWRPAEERRQASDVAEIVALRLLAEPAQHHVVDQSLTKWTDRCIENRIGHGRAPC